MPALSMILGVILGLIEQTIQIRQIQMLVLWNLPDFRIW
jgi:hypothetical protein